jgi:hypothetical protein
MNIEQREKQLREKIEQNNYVLCEKLLKELLDNKFARAHNSSLAAKQLQVKFTKVA